MVKNGVWSIMGIFCCLQAAVVPNVLAGNLDVGALCFRARKGFSNLGMGRIRGQHILVASRNGTLEVAMATIVDVTGDIGY